MQWIIDHFQIVLLVLLGLGSLIKSRFDAKKAQESEGTPDPAADSAPPVRQRQPSVPPPLQRPGLPMAEQEAAREAAGVLKHQQDLAARLRQIRDTKATTSGGAAATRVRVARERAGKPVAVVPISLRSRLRDPQEVRRALLMREILDPPLGLR